MKTAKLVIALSLAASLSVLAVSCCKEETTTKSTLLGTMSINLSSYVQKGEFLSLSCSDIMKTDSSRTVGFYWTVPLFSVRDTLRLENDPVEYRPDFEFTVPDTLCTFSILQNAFAEGYTNMSTTSSTTIVDPSLNGDGSLTGFNIAASDGQFTDARDSKTYYYKNIGKLQWMRTNLRYAGTGYPYNDHWLMAEVFGQFYTWTEAQTACPYGWRLPSEADWVDLAKASGCEDAELGEVFTGIAGKLMMDAKFNGTKLWEFWPGVPITDEMGFSAISAGYGQKGNVDYTFFGCCEYAFFWTSSSVNDKGQARYIYQSFNDVYCALFEKNDICAPIRCVRDAQ